MIHKVNTNYLQGMAFEVKVDEFKMIMAADEEGPSPKKLMLASLAVCTGLDVVSVLNKMRVEFSDFSVDSEANLTDEHPKIYDSVLITYSIKVSEEYKSKVDHAIELSIEKYCGVMEMFRGFAKVITKTVFL
ncbi:MAG: OsmC family protein [Ferruginibacter sp.]